LLPVDAEFKGYEEVVVQDIKLTTDNVLFRKQKYYFPQREKLTRNYQMVTRENLDRESKLGD